MTEMSERGRPKYRFSKKVGEGEFLNLAVWPGKSRPQEGVVSVQLKKFDGTRKTLGRLALQDE